MSAVSVAPVRTGGGRGPGRELDERAALGVTRLAPLLAELGDLKRIRVAGRAGSLADTAFTRSWRRLLAGEDLPAVAVDETVRALVAVRLGGVDAAVLAEGGLAPADVSAVLLRAFDDVAAAVPDRESLRAAAGHAPVPDAGRGPVPDFVAALVAQPRAGATCPGRPRLLLEPVESHGDHCLTVAVYAVLLAPLFGADRATAYLLGLAHHLHNAGLPDAGYAGDVLIGEHVQTLMGTYRERALGQLPPEVRAQVQDALPLLAGTRAPESRAFHAADALDRVLQMRQYARAAAFTLDQAVGDLQLVHEGPEQQLQLAVLDAAGLWTARP